MMQTTCLYLTSIFYSCLGSAGPRNNYLVYVGMYRKCVYLANFQNLVLCFLCNTFWGFIFNKVSILFPCYTFGQLNVKTLLLLFPLNTSERIYRGDSTFWAQVVLRRVKQRRRVKHTVRNFQICISLPYIWNVSFFANFRLVAS